MPLCTSAGRLLKDLPLQQGELGVFVLFVMPQSYLSLDVRMQPMKCAAHAHGIGAGRPCKSMCNAYLYVLPSMDVNFIQTVYPDINCLKPLLLFVSLPSPGLAGITMDPPSSEQRIFPAQALLSQNLTHSLFFPGPPSQVAAHLVEQKQANRQESSRHHASRSALRQYEQHLAVLAGVLKDSAVQLQKCRKRQVRGVTTTAFESIVFFVGATAFESIIFLSSGLPALACNVSHHDFVLCSLSTSVIRPGGD